MLPVVPTLELVMGAVVLALEVAMEPTVLAPGHSIVVSLIVNVFKAIMRIVVPLLQPVVLAIVLAAIVIIVCRRRRSQGHCGCGERCGEQKCAHPYLLTLFSERE